ncbi:MAG TPA: hypothetical protein VJH22_03450 [Candidatus Nanoarchaeia archaeon]|nr:hypothetical protein [Candidatus Nanoarchaeia archaeon]
MKTEYIFYTAGSFFVLAALVYILNKDVFNLPLVFKSAILFCFSLFALLLGITLKERGL